MNGNIYRIALIGCGKMGAVHLDSIYFRENIVIQYVCDTNRGNAENFARRFNAVNAVTDYNTAVSAPDVDIVIIATPPSSHLEIFTECIRNGKHIICEKPISDSLENCKIMLNMIKENPQCKVLNGYILRHNETYRRAAEMIQSGAIGKPIVMRMVQNHHTMDWSRYLNLICETSPLIDCGVHYVDVMRWFTGEEISSVSGIGQRIDADVPEDKYNYALMTVKLSGGSVGYYEAGWGNTVAADNLKEFVGPKGRIKIILQDVRHENREEGDLIEYYTYPEKEYKSINVLCKRKPTDRQLDMLIGMIENDAQPVPSNDDILRSFEAVMQTDEIIKRGLFKEEE